MAKRRRSEDDDEDGTRHRRAAHRRRRRRGRLLHVIVHDYKQGCAVHKLDVDAFEPADSDSDSDLDRRARRLPRRAAARLASPGRALGDQFVSTGTSIFAFYPTAENASTLVYDTETSLVAICPPPLAPKNYPDFLAVGHDVYALDTTGGASLAPSLEKLGPAPRGGWGQWQWESLPPPPFKRLSSILLSHAGHPDGSAFFLSVKDAGTFSFDTDRHTWTRHGRWLLPFVGEAYFVRELDAWVGLSSQRKGYLVACQVFSPCDDGHGRRAGPACTSVRDRVYHGRWKRHLEVSLTYMGDAEFCVLETVTREGYDIFTENRVRMLLRLATFRVERHHGDGELRAVNMRTMIYKWPRRAYKPVNLLLSASNKSMESTR